MARVVKATDFGPDGEANPYKYPFNQYHLAMVITQPTISANAIHGLWR